MEPLWNARDQAKRLAELTAGTTSAEKEAPLRRDVRSLGVLLGRVLVEQGGQELLDSVEKLRRLLIQSREKAGSFAAEDNLMAEARALIAAMDVDAAHRLTKAFAIYFELTNLAETTHRKRRRRAAKLHTEQPPLAGSFRGTLLRMRDAGIASDDALAALQKVKIVPVFTAHPTEVARRTVLMKRRRIARLLESLDQLPLPESDAAHLEEQILAEITSLWQTDEVRLQKPGVIDEVRMGLDYYPMTIFETLPKLYAEFAESFAAVYGRRLGIDDLRDVIRFGSWIGGDRDGNPLITPPTTADALEMARHVVLDFYLQETRRLTDRLSSSMRQTGCSDELRAALATYEAMLRGEASHGRWISETELTRRFLDFVRIRLEYCRNDRAMRAPISRRRSWSATWKLFARVSRQTARRGWRRYWSSHFCWRCARLASGSTRSMCGSTRSCTAKRSRKLGVARQVRQARSLSGRAMWWKRSAWWRS